jgi:hypothetical protein
VIKTDLPNRSRFRSVNRLNEKVFIMKPFTIVFAAVFAIVAASAAFSEVVTYNDSWSEAGYNLISQSPSGVEVVFSIERMNIQDLMVDGQTMKVVGIPGVFLPNNAGAPNLPGNGRFLAVPKGASANVQILSSRVEVIEDIEIAPAPPIPFEWDNSPPVYKKDPSIYSKNAYYPDSPVKLSELSKMRGVDYVILGITPFQYNPVTKELLVYRDLRVRVDFIGGNGHFGEDRLRSRFWEPILQGNLLNYASLPEVDFNRVPSSFSETEDVEYLIIVPDDLNFIAWADTIKHWRNLQGIRTGVVTLSEIGGNNSSMIEAYINNAYHNWDPAPVAVLLLSDYQSSGKGYGITSPLWNGYCVSDNIYADIEGNNDLPDLAIARITAQNATHLSNTIGKMLEYERTPPTDPGFYNVPLIAGGWQSDRWFILCCEVILGYFETQLDKSCDREYSGRTSPPTYWSTNQNTWMIVDYFGPDGLGYIPEVPSHLNDWTGSASGINSRINSGTFVVQHRDHGDIDGWSSPSYRISDLNNLHNDKYPFVFSMNCLTGKYNNSSQCFAEAFHREQQRAMGIMAATEVSYSFVNDAYTWGVYDALWPNFDPGYGNNPVGAKPLQTCFANAYGKYYLQASNWPYNPQHKVYTHHLFHHHGGAFTTLYSEVPQHLSVSHDPTLLPGATEFAVTANAGALIGLTVDGEIIGVGEGTGSPVQIQIEPQQPGATMIVTVTLANYYRYQQEVPVEGLAVVIGLEPDNPPVVVPRGGSFGFTGTVTNNTDEVQDVDIWTMAYVPGIGMYGPLKQFANLRFAPHQSRQAHFYQRVSNSAPVSDEYLYCGYVGDYPSVSDSSWFPFEVIAGALTKAGEQGWALTGSFLEGSFVDLPSEFALMKNYPNPFNAQTVIDYQLPTSSDVKLEVYNLLGKKVGTLVDQQQEAGYKSVTWDASEVSSGIYFYKLNAGEYTETMRMTLIK